jgi:hypothetical protein
MKLFALLVLVTLLSTTSYAHQPRHYSGVEECAYDSYAADISVGPFYTAGGDMNIEYTVSYQNTLDLEQSFVRVTWTPDTKVMVICGQQWTQILAFQDTAIVIETR